MPSFNLQIRPAYVPVEQVNYLQVRSVPSGSTSHIDANGLVVPGKSVGTPVVAASPVKKAKHSHSQESVPTTQASTSESIREEEKSAKKHKKEKKQKDSKKDKSS